MDCKLKVTSSGEHRSCATFLKGIGINTVMPTCSTLISFMPDNWLNAVIFKLSAIVDKVSVGLLFVVVKYNIVSSDKVTLLADIVKSQLF